MNREIMLLKTRETAVSLAVNNILLHSMYYPLKESYNFARYREKYLKDKKNIVIYGVGLGYHILELLKLIDKKSNIYVFDIDEEIVDISLKNGVLKEVLEDKRVKFLYGYNKETLESLSVNIKNCDYFVVFKPSLRVLPKEYEDFKGAMDRFEIGVIELERNGQIAKENSALNSTGNYEKIDKFYEKYDFKNKPVIIAAAGPSLSINIDGLRKVRDKVIILAVGSALRSLMNSGIKPDMMTIIDPQEIVYEQIKGFEDLPIPLCFLSTASNLTVTKYRGPKYIFYNEKGKDSMVIETGKSVATAALEIAIKANANPVIFLGQDLAYINNKAHCDEYANFEDGAENIFMKNVEGVGGSTVKSNAGLLYFKRWIEHKIAANPQIKFINCSGGARIKGTIEMNIEDVFSKN